MEIIIYSQIDNPQKDKLLREISQVKSLTHVMAFDFKDLFRLVKSKISDQVIIVFLISSAEELEFLISHKDRLFNSRYILILLNEEESIISKGFSLFPKYLTNADYEFTDVAAVLDKMIQNHDAFKRENKPGGKDKQ